MPSLISCSIWLHSAAAFASARPTTSPGTPVALAPSRSSVMPKRMSPPDALASDDISLKNSALSSVLLIFSIALYSSVLCSTDFVSYQTQNIFCDNVIKSCRMHVCRSSFCRHEVFNECCNMRVVLMYFVCDSTNCVGQCCPLLQFLNRAYTLTVGIA